MSQTLRIVNRCNTFIFNVEPTGIGRSGSFGTDDVRHPAVLSTQRHQKSRNLTAHKRAHRKEGPGSTELPGFGRGFWNLATRATARPPTRQGPTYPHLSRGVQQGPAVWCTRQRVERPLSIQTVYPQLTKLLVDGPGQRTKFRCSFRILVGRRP